MINNSGLVDNPEVYLEMYRQGKLGTPDNPNRGNTAKQTFWAVYSGAREAGEYRNTMVYAAARAGKMQADQDRKDLGITAVSFGTTVQEFNPHMADDLMRLRDEVTLRAFDASGNVRDAGLAEVVYKMNSVLFRGYPRR